MKTEYLLPCQCGEKLVVDRSQAGLSVRCQCGREAAIPTLRGLERLERAEVPASATATREWGLRQAVLFFGGILAGFSLLAVAWLWLTRPVYPQEYHDAMVNAAGSTLDIDQITPVQTFEMWKALSQTPDQAPLPEYQRLVTAFQYFSAQFRRRILFALAAAIVGGVILGVGFVLPKTGPALR